MNERAHKEEERVMTVSSRESTVRMKKRGNQEIQERCGQRDRRKTSISLGHRSQTIKTFSKLR